MKRTVILLGILAAGVVGLVMMGCQSKEVTSAKVYIQQNDWDKAMEQLQIAVDLYPQDPEAHFLLGQAYAVKSDFVNMNKEFKVSSELSPKFEPQIKNEREKHWIVNFNSGVKRVNADQLDAAEKDFKVCTVIDPTRVEAYKNLGYTYIQMDSIDLAIESYEKAIDIDPEDSNAISALINLYFKAEEFPKVLVLSQKQLEKNPTDLDAISNIALAYDYMDEKDKALETYQKALEVSPDDSDIIFNLARLYYLREDYQKAIEQFQKVIDKNPNDFDSNANVGKAYLTIAERLRKAAIAEEEAGKQFTQEEVEELRQKIRQYHCTAIPFLEKAIELKPEDINAWYNLGVAYVNCGMTEKGKEAFDKAEQLKTKE